MIFCKLSGSCVLLLCCWGLGYAYAEKNRNHRKAVQDIQLLLCLLKENLYFPKMPLLVFLNNCAENTTWKIIHPGKQSFHPSDDYEQAILLWMKSAGFLSLLHPAEQSSLKQLLSGMGKLSAEAEEKALALQIKAKDTEIQELLEKEKTDSKLYHALGCLGGLALMLILI